MSRLVGDKFVFMEDVVVICFGWVVVMCRFVWEKVDLLRVCVKVLIFESFWLFVYLFVFLVKVVVIGMVEEMEVSINFYFCG